MQKKTLIYTQNYIKWRYCTYIDIYCLYTLSNSGITLEKEQQIILSAAFVSTVPDLEVFLVSIRVPSLVGYSLGLPAINYFDAQLRL